MKKTDKYIKIVQWSEEDGCYIGTCPGLMEGGVHGDNETKVYQELCQTVEELTRPPKMKPVEGRVSWW